MPGRIPRQDPHGRVAARRREAGGEEDERLRRFLRSAVLQHPLERFEEAARTAGQIGSRFRARRLPRHTACRHPDTREIRRERHHDPAERQRHDHRAIRRRELCEQSFNRIPEERLASGGKGLLIDDEHDASAGRHVVVRAERSRHACGHVRVRQRRGGGDVSQRSHHANAIADTNVNLG
jgi:hypothetical protein